MKSLILPEFLFTDMTHCGTQSLRKKQSEEAKIYLGFWKANKNWKRKGSVLSFFRGAATALIGDKYDVVLVPFLAVSF